MVNVPGAGTILDLASPLCRSTALSKKAMTHYSKKIWTAGGSLADHRMLFRQLPKILGAYVGPNSIPAQLNEAVMVTVNSVNSCPYCKGLHGQLARMAGVSEAEPLMQANSAEECRRLINDPAIGFARLFAENDGRGDAVDIQFAQLATAIGAGKAKSVRALCWFLLWGSIGGNTINAFLSRIVGKPKADSSALFELFFFIYYGPLFLIIAIVNALLRFFPRVPSWFSAGFGVLLTVIASVWILTPGILAQLIPSRPRILQFG